MSSFLTTFLWHCINKAASCKYSRRSGVKFSRNVSTLFSVFGDFSSAIVNTVSSFRLSIAHSCCICSVSFFVRPAYISITETPLFPCGYFEFFQWAWFTYIFITNIFNPDYVALFLIFQLSNQIRCPWNTIYDFSVLGI